MASHPYVSIASGIGGLDLGVERGSSGTAFPVCYVENEITAASVLAARMAEGALPEAPIWSDVKTFDGSEWRDKVAGVVAGYPCQPFSPAGQKKGADDPRNIWPDIVNVIKDVRPQWCFFENVSHHLRLGYFQFVRPSLESLGFRCKEQLVAAADVGAPQTRKRLFILAYAGDADAASTYLQSESTLVDANGIEPSKSKSDAKRTNLFISAIASRRLATTFPPSRKGQETKWEQIEEYYWPTIQPSIRRMADGLSTGLGLPIATEHKLFGNAVVPDQAALAWRILWRAMIKE